MKILICQFGNETNTFAPGLTQLKDLSLNGWIPGEQVEPLFGSTNSYLGGAITAIRQAGETPLSIDILTNNGNFGAGPLMSAECVREALDHICCQTLDDRPFLMTGADLKDYRIVGLKSMNHFRGYFTPLADAIITADTPGARPASLSLYPYEHVKRPIYPLDPDTEPIF